MRFPRFFWSFFEFTLILMFLTSVEIAAAVPASFSYQGRLTDSADEPLDGAFTITFSIYSDSLGTTFVWSEKLENVPVSKGLFSVVLGKVIPLTAAVFDGSARWLGIQVDSDSELRPLRQLVSVPAAFQALYADTSQHARTIADNSVTSAKISNGTISFADIGQNGAISGQIMKWNGSAWAAAADAQGSNTSGWSDNGTVVNLSDPLDTVALNTSSRLGKININGDIGLTGTSSIFFGSSSARLSALAGNEMRLYGDDISLMSTESVYFTQLGVDTWAEFDNVNRRVGIGTINPDDRLHVENDLAGSCWLKIQGSHATNWGQTGLRVQTPANTWHLRQDLYTHANFPEGALSLYSSGGAVEAMTWLENGRVGVGTTSPTRKLHVAGSVQVRDTLYAGALDPSLINSSQLPDEPGAEWVYSIPSIYLGEASTDLVSAEIEVPAPGYILAFGQCNFSMQHTWNDMDLAHFGIGPISGSYANTSWYGFGSSVESGTHYLSALAFGAFTVDAAGTYEYFFTGRKTGPATTLVSSANLMLVYVPTRYESPKQGRVQEPVLDLTAVAAAIAGQQSPDPHSREILSQRIADLESEIAALKAAVGVAKK